MNHLHLHSTYSILDGLSKVEAIVKKAKEQGADAVAITDHASVSALPDLFKYAKQEGIKPIIGCEFYWVDDAAVMEKGEHRRHLIVWAKSWEGVQSIMRHLTLANSQFYRRPRLSWEQCLDFKDCMIGTACGSGVLCCDNYTERVTELIATYGNDNVYLEVMPHAVIQDGVDLFATINKRAIELAKNMDCQLLATNDSHYVNREDAHTQEVLLAIQTGASWDDPKRWKWDGDDYFMASQKEMYAGFVKLDYLADCMDFCVKAMANCYLLPNKVNVEMPKYEVTLPSPYKDGDDDGVFKRKLIEGWKELIDSKVDDEKTYRDRLLYEISVIGRRGFTKYFLIVEDIIKWARAQGIMVGPARGSSAGSLVCYLLGITQIDPLKHGLFFERFLNPDRIDLPDIDVDFQDDRRDEVFAYIRNKYGVEHTANINTYGTLSVKSAFRDVSRVFGVNAMQVNLLSKLIEDEESFDKVSELVKFKNEHPKIVEQVKKLDGVIRQVGVHPCGLLLSNQALTNVAVIERRKDTEVINWDMKQSEGFGLIKIDILGLATLTILDMARKLVKANKGIDDDYVSIPLTDEKTLEAFCNGDTVGVFQFEGAGMIALLKGLKARDFETITATTALYRPGSLNSGQTETYVQIYKGNEYETYVCEQLKPILGNTKGVMVYQEQIMQIFNQLAGFTWAEADRMRKIIGKKLGKDEFEKHREHFVKGCETNGIDNRISGELFDKMVEFASYVFNKSHACAYSTISFWTMYMKVHFPVEFMTAQMTYTNDDRILVMVRECKKLGIDIAMPDINRSEKHYAILDEKTIQAPLGVIKGIGSKAVDAILEARTTGVFLSQGDFIERVQRRIVNSRVVEILYKAGVFESLGHREADAEKRNKNYAELLPIFDVLPTLNKKGKAIGKEVINTVLMPAFLCGRDHGNKSMLPRALGANPSVMVLNNPVSTETDHLTNDGSKYFLKVMKSLGVSPARFYYTSPLKCFYVKIAKAPKECLARCFEYLKEEIKAIKPSVIVCFANQATQFFGGEKEMRKMDGKVIYNKEFDCYVLFSYSPQYAYFSEDKQASFVSNMAKLRDMFIE
jgi:DNA polymerase-3 subunit alpha